MTREIFTAMFKWVAFMQKHMRYLFKIKFWRAHGRSTEIKNLNLHLQF
jgi:hypothetical protein